MVIYIFNDTEYEINELLPEAKKAFEKNFKKTIGINFYKLVPNLRIYFNLKIDEANIFLWDINYLNEIYQTYLSKLRNSGCHFVAYLFLVEKLNKKILKDFLDVTVGIIGNGCWYPVGKILTNNIEYSTTTVEALKKIGIIEYPINPETFEKTINHIFLAKLETYVNPKGRNIKPYKVIYDYVSEYLNQTGELENLAKKIIKGKDLTKLIPHITTYFNNKLALKVISVIVNNRLREVLEILSSDDLSIDEKAKIVLTLSLYGSTIFEDELIEIARNASLEYACEAIDRFVTHNPDALTRLLEDDIILKRYEECRRMNYIKFQEK